MPFVNLPLSHVVRHPHYLELFLECRINPELGLDAWACDHLGLDWHRNLARTLSESGLSCSIHLPFFDLQPGGLDSLIVKATRERLSRALDLADVYAPKRLVAHGAFRPPLYEFYLEDWVRESVRTWEHCLDSMPDSGLLVLENVWETSPEPLLRVLAELPEKRVGLCLDLGHWYAFGQGWERKDLNAWIEKIAPRLAHVHLHDNHGHRDEHLGMGCGTIPWAEFFECIRRFGARPTATLEPHESAALIHSLHFLVDRGQDLECLSLTGPPLQKVLSGVSDFLGRFEGAQGGGGR